MGNLRDLPRTIWIYWDQGISAAPFVVRQCVQSWRLHNADWTIRVLSKGDIESLVALDRAAFTGIGLSQWSDVLRLALLARYGGVWADATCFCLRPLDDWLPAAVDKAGYFAFLNPGRDRILSSWFLAARPNHPLVLAHLEGLVSYLQSVRWRNADRHLIVLSLEGVSRIHPWATRVWFTPLVHRRLRVHPYFAFHYVLATLLRHDGDLRRMWELVDGLPAAAAHTLIKAGLLSPATGTSLGLIAEPSSPVWKLTWKVLTPDGVPPPGSLLDCLFSTWLD